MYKTNKEIIDVLTKHFLELDPEEVALALAGTLLDFHRLLIYESLPVSEQQCLDERLNLNEQEFLRFAKDGPRKGDAFTGKGMNSGNVEQKKTNKTKNTVRN